MLALGMRYLNGWAMATHPASYDEAEWPPHPDRVFMALAAACFETDGSPRELAVLRWLEAAGSPHLAVDTEAFRRDIVTSYVPVNDTRSGLELLPTARPRQARSFPVAIPAPQEDGMPRLYLIWPEAECPDVDALATLCEKVTSVGHSASLVQMWVEGTPPEPRLVPQDGLTAPLKLRVPYGGRLADLEQAFGQKAVEIYDRLLEDAAGANKSKAREAKSRLKEEFANAPPRPLRPVARRWQSYSRSLGPEEVTAPPGTVFLPELLVLRRIDGPRLGLQSTIRITEALRGAMLKRLATPIPEWISGHTDEGAPSALPHVALLPLPDVGHPYASGHLLGVAVAVPKDVPRADQRRLAPLLFYTEADAQLDASVIPGTPRSIRLTLGTLGVLTLELDEQTTSVALDARLWSATRPRNRGSRFWGTVTPIVFDRHPKDRWSRTDPPRVRAEQEAAYWAEVEDTIAEACIAIGLPKPESVTALSSSCFTGVPRGSEMPRVSRNDGTKRRHTHALIRFVEPIVGPVTLGAGRFRGYGLCRPLEEGAA